MTYTKENPSTIQALFDSIATRYDLGNAVLSCNLHRLWNRRLVGSILQHRPTVVLDACSGTGDIAKRMFCKQPDLEVYLVDFSPKMLELARANVPRFRAKFYLADAQELPFNAATFDAATCAYGIRNIDDRKKALQELFRVLKPGGHLAILELTRPQNVLLKLLHRLYLKTMVPLVGRAITSNKQAYRYLSASIDSFISPEQLRAELEDAGFCNIEAKPQSFGIATLFLAGKL